MMLAATGFVHKPENIGIVASTGCNTVYGSTYPYNPYIVPWTNSLFENGPADAMGIRARWDQRGWGDKKLWVIGGDGAMYDIGFQSLSRMLASSMDINVLILDKQVYSNTGGQASTATFAGQEAKMAVDSRAFPIFIYDPRKGEKIRERLSLVGNPSQKEDWWTPSSTGKPFTFVDFARTEGRFTKQFDGDGNPSSILLQTQEERLRNWHTLQEPIPLRPLLGQPCGSLRLAGLLKG